MIVKHAKHARGKGLWQKIKPSSFNKINDYQIPTCYFIINVRVLNKTSQPRGNCQRKRKEK